MYQALYRKYRPDDFNSVVGQDVIVTTLKNAINANKITHAYLFTGPRGTGKTSIAKIFAKTINCENLQNCTPCNECVSCTQIINKTSTDIIEIDAASNNGVDEIRELKSKISLVPNVSKYKVYIIDEVHMLTTGAFNALLKTLEEPPQHVIFILATTEPQKIPSTILSRCQRYDFKKISCECIINRLKYICENEKIDINEDALNEIARISDGGMRDAISILDQVVSYKSSNITLDDVHMINGTLTQSDLKDFIKSLLTNDLVKVFDNIDWFNNMGKNLQKLLDEIILFLRNLILYKKIPNYFNEKNIDITSYQELQELVDVEKIYNLINNFNKLSVQLKNTTNPKIMFEIEMLNNMNISREIKNSTKDSLNEKEIEPENSIKLEKDKPKIINTEEFINFKNIRIDNILSKLDKKNIVSVIEKRNVLKSFLLDKNIGKFASLLLDGAIKAGSEEGLIYVYEYDEDVEIFNNNILELEEILLNNINRKYKLISVSMNEWNTIREEFNKKLKKYEYKEEPSYPQLKIETNEIIIKKDNDMENFFDDIVEYTKEEF